MEGYQAINHIYPSLIVQIPPYKNKTWGVFNCTQALALSHLEPVIYA